jgi:hypothetical protein
MTSGVEYLFESRGATSAPGNQKGAMMLRKTSAAAAAVTLVAAGAALFSGSALANDDGKKKHGIDIDQTNACYTDDVNVALLNNIGIANGLAGNLIGGKGDPGAQTFSQGGAVACSNAVGS